MPPLFKMSLTVNPGTLDNLKALPTRARGNLRSKLRTDLAPALEAEANRLMPTLNPPGASHPFEFGGVLSGVSGYDPKNPSRRKYFAMVAAGQVPSDGNAYARTGEIETSFEVEIASQFIENLIRILNRHPKAKYLYGPWSVAGHRNTGWELRIPEARSILRKSGIVKIKILWREAVAEAARGKG